MTQTMESLCKANWATSHYVIASFFSLSTMSNLSKVSFITGKLAMYRMLPLKLIKYSRDL